VPYFNWISDYSVHVDEIDNQHKELINRVDKLLEACNQGAGKTVLPEILDFLGNYVVEHFSTEERLMQQYNYPDYSMHKQEHENFIKSYSELKKYLETNGTGVLSIVKTNRIVVEWLKNHILGTDKKLGAYINQKTNE